MIDTRSTVISFRALESLAVIPRVSSTNLVARRIVDECIANKLSLPQAMILAGEQLAGRGRDDRTWSSPRDKGIYATMLVTREAKDLSLIPLRMASTVANFLRETFEIDAGIKWPNDILAGGRKISGILIEARIQERRAYVTIGIGVNVEPVAGDDRPNATSIRECARRNFRGLDAATLAFAQHIDASLEHPLVREHVIGEWRRLTVHRPGDRITSILGDRTISGIWSGIDDEGRALVLDDGGELHAVSAGEIVMR